MKISIIVPVFNLENYIEKTLDSIFAQTFRDIEVICVNDGSTDSTKDIIELYCKKEPRLTVINKINEGVSKARLTGIKAASGDYIGFVDGDDIIDPDMYERLLYNVLKYGCDISHCGYRVIRNDKTEYFYNTGDLIIQDNKEGIYDLLDGSKIEPGLCNKLFKKSLFKGFSVGNSIMDFRLKNNEDLLMNYILFSESKKSVYEDFCPYQYIVREESASKGKISENKLLDPIRASDIIYQNTGDDIDIKRISARLYSVKLIHAATYYDSDEEFVQQCRKTSQKHLKSFISDYLKLENNIKRKALAVLAAYAPKLYYRIHKLYLK